MNRPISALRSDIPTDSGGPATVLGTADAGAGPAQGARLYHARLVMRDGQRYAALTEEGASWVSPAAGCLLQPEVGDLVLLSLVAGQGYILTVLERGTPESIAHIEIPGSLRLTLPDGRLEVHASAGMALDAGPALSVAAQDASVAFSHADVSCRTMRVAGEDLHTSWDARTDVSGTRLDIAARSETHATESVRRIAGHEEVTAGSLRQNVSDDWSVQAGSADLKARDRVAVDAGSVQIG
jgi:hypothetical protein